MQSAPLASLGGLRMRRRARGMGRRRRRRRGARERGHPDVARHGYEGPRRRGRFAGALFSPRRGAPPDRRAERDQRAGAAGGGARPLDDRPSRQPRRRGRGARGDAGAPHRAFRCQRLGGDECGGSAGADWRACLCARREPTQGVGCARVLCLRAIPRRARAHRHRSRPRARALCARLPVRRTQAPRFAGQLGGTRQHPSRQRRTDAPRADRRPRRARRAGRRAQRRSAGNLGPSSRAGDRQTRARSFRAHARDCLRCVARGDGRDRVRNDWRRWTIPPA